METGFWQRFLDRAKELWGTPLGKILTVTIGSVLITGLVVGLLSRKPPMETLGTFDPELAPKVVAKLGEKKIDFVQSGAGYTIEVRQTDLNAARLALAEAGLSDDITWTSVPWQTKSAWNATEMDKRINYKQLVEEDLARAIRTMSKVQNAKVIISLPEKALYAKDTKPPKASVILQPRPRLELSGDEVRGIIMMVSSAVDGLTADNVVVLDAVRNRAISENMGTPDSTMQAMDALKIQEQYQQMWERRLTERLEQVMGSGNVSVLVNVVLDWELLRTEALTYTDQVPLSTQEVRKSSEGSGGTTGQPGGTDANTPAAPTYRAGEDGGNFSSEESSQIINYLVGQEKVTSERVPGSVKEIAVAVFVNEDKIDAAQTARVREMVEAAVGTTASRVDVAAMKFDDTLSRQLTEEPVVTVAGPNYVYYGIAAAAAIAAVMFAAVAIRRRRQEELQPAFAGMDMEGLTVAEMEAAADEEEEDRPMKVPTTLEELAQMPPEDVALLGDEFLEKLGVDPVKMRIRERVERLARQNPEQVATLLKSWIAEE